MQTMIKMIVLVSSLTAFGLSASAADMTNIPGVTGQKAYKTSSRHNTSDGVDMSGETSKWKKPIDPSAAQDARDKARINARNKARAADKLKCNWWWVTGPIIGAAGYTACIDAVD